MDNRKLGQLEVSPIGMGCMGFSHGYGQVPPKAYAIEAIRKAYDYGCTHFDTAEAYGKEQFYAGHNEELVGKAIETITIAEPDLQVLAETVPHIDGSIERIEGGGCQYTDRYSPHLGKRRPI